MKVFVEWDDRPLSDASWILLKSLNKESTQWWKLLKEVRYPHFPERMFPSIPISGFPDEHLSDLDCDTISESPAYPLASSGEGQQRKSVCYFKIDFGLLHEN